MTSLIRHVLAATILITGASSVEASDRRIDIAAHAGKPDGGTHSYRLAKGDEVTLAVTADTDGQLHVHGYEIATPIVRGRLAIVQFKATRTGRFVAELHPSEVPLAVLEIYP